MIFTWLKIFDFYFDIHVPLRQISEQCHFFLRSCRGCCYIFFRTNLASIGSHCISNFWIISIYIIVSSFSMCERFQIPVGKHFRVCSGTDCARAAVSSVLVSFYPSLFRRKSCAVALFVFYPHTVQPCRPRSDTYSLQYKVKVTWAHHHEGSFLSC